MECDQSDVIVRGPLALNLATGVLTGPAGAVVVAPAVGTTLALLLGRALLNHHLLPGVSLAAYRMRISRARSALETVGAGSVLHRLAGGFYAILIQREALVRSYVGPQVGRLDRLLATHPNRQAVARLMTG